MHTRHLYLPTEEEIRSALTLRDAANIARQYAESRLGDPTRKGCYLAVLSPAGDLVLHLPLGTVSPEKEVTYALFAREKVMRTFAHDNHISSWQSHVIDENRGIFQYGGAVRFLCTTPWLGWSVGISGYPEAVDEAIALSAGIIVGATIRDFVDEVIGISDNPSWDAAAYNAALRAR